MSIDFFKDSILLSGEITWETIGKIYEQLSVKGWSKLTLFITSQGGDRDAGISLLSLLKGTGYPLTTVAVGKVYSAAIFPFLAASKDRRFALPDSLFLFHPTTFDMEGEISPNTLKELISADEHDSKCLQSLLAEVSNNLPSKELSQMVSPSTSIFIPAEAAAHYGLVTKVVKTFNEIPG